MLEGQMSKRFLTSKGMEESQVPESILMDRSVESVKPQAFFFIASILGNSSLLVQFLFVDL